VTLHFQHLRNGSMWSPGFKWVHNRRAAADGINIWHEDHPARVEATIAAIRNSVPFAGAVGYEKPVALAFHRVHKLMFRDKPYAGNTRTLNVSVGSHTPPRYQEINKHLRDLARWTPMSITTVEEILDWYTDFETIHPYQGGNGLVGGVMVAVYSHALHPEKGWLRPLQ
jgi:fido (protein-threonine AMPylation protein)